MKLLIAVFLGMFVYGVVTMHLGGALLALLMAGFVQFARGHFAKEDARWEALPQHAKQQQGTQQALCDYDCECMRDRL